MLLGILSRLSYGFWMWTGLVIWQFLAWWRLYVHRAEFKDIKRERMLLGIRLYPLYKHLSKMGQTPEEGFNYQQGIEHGLGVSRSVLLPSKGSELAHSARMGTWKANLIVFRSAVQIYLKHLY